MAATPGRPPDDHLIAFLAALKSDGILEDVADVVRRLRRTPGAWKLMRQDLEESERRRSGGCVRYALDHDFEGMASRFRSLGTERVVLAAGKIA